MPASTARRSLPEIETALKDPGRRITPGFRVATVHLRDGSTLRGLLKNESTFDLQLQGLDAKLHLLDGDAISSVDRDNHSLMPPVKSDAAEYHDLLAYLSRLAGGAPVHALEQPVAEEDAPARGLEDAGHDAWIHAVSSSLR